MLDGLSRIGYGENGAPFEDGWGAMKDQEECRESDPCVDSRGCGAGFP